MTEEYISPNCAVYDFAAIAARLAEIRREENRQVRISSFSFSNDEHYLDVLWEFHEYYKGTEEYHQFSCHDDAGILKDDIEVSSAVRTIGSFFKLMVPWEAPNGGIRTRVKTWAEGSLKKSDNKTGGIPNMTTLAARMICLGLVNQKNYYP